MSTNELWSMLIRIVLATLGVLELLFPRRLTDYVMNVTTVGEATYEYKSWVYSIARIEGLVFILAAIRLGKDPDEDE
ncbi:hypothetical protein GCM10008995_26660 [Halobellus salinus]|uniref:Uncharacterized protein n=2 Tax=Halobellus salinus TaxID=931585 RepID=A0A830EDN2_9EURY|nr:hypothetical protein [Halobellus salinus]GGJ15492.1 hypothetical protein GCM10008995_26660 [Halobellus salinus]